MCTHTKQPPFTILYLLFAKGASAELYNWFRWQKIKFVSYEAEEFVNKDAMFVDIATGFRIRVCVSTCHFQVSPKGLVKALDHAYPEKLYRNDDLSVILSSNEQ